MSARITGIMPAAITWFNADLSLAIPDTIAYYRTMLDAGCDGIVSMGTTGEANSLSFRERCALIDAVGESGFAGKVIAGIGCCNLPETAELGRIAAAAGLSGLLIMPPFFYRGISDEGVFAAYDHVLGQLGADPLPVYIYDFPKMSGIDIALETIEQLRRAYPGLIAGLKNSAGDFEEMQCQHAAFDDFDVFAGSEEFLLPAMQAGLAGCISASFNVFAEDAAALMRVWRQPEAEARQHSLTAKRRAIAAYPLIPAAKALIGDARGSSLAVRPPLMALKPDELAALKQSLSEVEEGA